MIVGRIFGWLLIAASLAAAGRELVSWLETGAYRTVAAGELWYDLDPASLNLVQAVVQRYLLPELWDPVIATALLAPAWALLSIPGLALAVLFRRRRRRRRRRW